MAAQLRDLLMDAGVLPAIDKWILHYQRWMAGQPAGITNPDHAMLPRQFAT
jgi:hypothetical protein